MIEGAVAVDPESLELDQCNKPLAKLLAIQAMNRHIQVAQAAQRGNVDAAVDE